MKKPSPIECSQCDNKLEFGGMSLGMSGVVPKSEIMPHMARMIGWRETSDGWVCRKHP